MIDWRAVVDALPVAICILDASGRVRGGNQALAALLETTEEQWIGQPWLAVVPPGWAGAIGTALEVPDASLIPEVTGRGRAFRVTAHRIGGTAGSGHVLAFEDQTEQRRLQQQLIQSEKMSAIGQLIAGVAHDLNNPLASVVGFADFLGDAPDVPARLSEPIEVIRQEAERAAGIVRNLLGFARKHEGERRPVELRAVLRATLDLIRNQLQAERIEATLELDPDLPPVLAEPAQLQQVFLNLLANAAHAIASTGRPGRVTIAAAPAGGRVRIVVADDGPGIPAGDESRIFEPFYSTKRPGEGTGLGLSISSGIVRELGGSLRAESPPEGGARFVMELPATQRRRGPAPASRPPAATRSVRVLVVDDEPHLLHFMRTTLSAWGHDVVVAHSGAEALDQARHGSFDLVLCDLRMPGLGGREFHEALHQLDPDLATRLVFCTGDTVRDDTLAFLKGLDRPWLHKPFRLAELRDLLAAAAGPPPH